MLHPAFFRHSLSSAIKASGTTRWHAKAVRLGHLDLELKNLVSGTANLQQYRLLVKRLEVAERRIQILLLVGERRKPRQVHAPVHKILRTQKQQCVDGLCRPLAVGAVSAKGLGLLLQARAEIVCHNIPMTS